MFNPIVSAQRTLASFKFKTFYKATLSCLAAILLFINTGCTGNDSTAKTNLDNPPPGKITELYKPITPAAGGMNNYSDVDPRVDTSDARAKADRLIKQAKDLERQDTNPLQQIQKSLDKKGLPARVDDLSEDLSRSAQETADGVAKGTRKGFGNLKQNAKSFKDDVESAADDLGRKTRANADNIQDNLRRAN